MNFVLIIKMWDNLILDFLYLCSDLFTGKSIPVLLAVTLYVVDPFMLGTMVLLGASVGAIGNMLKTRIMPQSPLVSWGMRFLQYSVANVMSLALLIRIASIMEGNAVTLIVIPSIWVIVHSAPERATFLCISMLWSLVLFYSSLLVPSDRQVNIVLDSAEPPDALMNYVEKPHLMKMPAPVAPPEQAMRRRLLAMTPEEWRHHLWLMDTQRYPTQSYPALYISTDHPIMENLVGSFCIFFLMVFATLQHGPFFGYEQRLCSSILLLNHYYSAFVCFLSAFFRAYVVIMVAWMHQNMIHLALEGFTPFHWVLWVYMVCLLMSVNLSIAHVSHQILTVLKGDPYIMKLKYTFVLIIISSVYPWIQNATHWLGWFAVLEIVVITVHLLTR